jgi:type II secretory pathway component PulC
MQALHMKLQLNQRHLAALNFLLIAGVAYFLALAVNQLILQSLLGGPSAPPAVSVHAGEAKNHPRAYYDAIVTRDIFNLRPLPTPAPVIKSVDLHKTLLGTSLSSKANPFAIVEDENGEQSLYTIGDDIPGAGRLISVQKSKIIIQHDGQPVALQIPNNELAGAPLHVPLPSSYQERRRRFGN